VRGRSKISELIDALFERKEEKRAKFEKLEVLKGNPKGKGEKRCSS